MRTSKCKVPVVVLSGFLGSGKTTLLNRLLRATIERGLKPGVLMNELGLLDVDGAWLRTQFDDLTIEKLIDGCICCSKKSEIPSSITALLGKRPDVLFIELTGVANPEEIADALCEPQLLDIVALQRVVTVIDAEHVLDYNSFFHSDKALIRTLRRQIEVADWLVVNKTELVTERTVGKIAKLLGKHNPAGRVDYVSQCAVDVEVMLAGVSPIAEASYPFAVKRSPFQVLRHIPQGALEEDELASSPMNEVIVDPSFTRLKTISFRMTAEQVPTREHMEQFLRAEMRRGEQQLLRAKGFMDGRIMHFAGQHIVWQPSSFSGEPYLVLIGLDLDVERMTRAWQELARD